MPSRSCRHLYRYQLRAHRGLKRPQAYDIQAADKANSGSEPTLRPHPTPTSLPLNLLILRRCSIASTFSRRARTYLCISHLILITHSLSLSREPSRKQTTQGVGRRGGKLTTATSRPHKLIFRRRLLAITIHSRALATAAGCFGGTDAALAGAAAAGGGFGGCHCVGRLPVKLDWCV